MNMILAVAAGGAIGATGRFLVGRLMLKLMGSGFPWGTLSVNIIGSFLIGIVAGAMASRYNLSHAWQGFLIIGVLGGFTTFSAFSLEVALMIEKHQISTAAFYSLASVIIGVLALFAGLYAGKTFI